ncbi:MAG TPA: alpha/beta hydrolase [Micromonosporaceae bacterium]
MAGMVVGVAAAGVAVGVAAERLLFRRNRVTVADPYVNEPFGRLPYDDAFTVPSVQDLDLYVEVVEPVGGVDLDLDFVPRSVVPEPAAEPTVVFVHGFALDMGTYHFQRKELTRRGDYRMVFYDQPGHGRSGRLDSGEYTLDMLGEALKDVLEATAPTGPIVLVGHSMGGMTVMALAEQHPELFGDRIQGVVFLSTSAGRLDEVTFGLPEVVARFRRPLLPLIAQAGKVTVAVLDRARAASSDLAWLLTRKYGFGSTHPSPSVVSYVEQMNSNTPVEVIARYLRAIYSHARFPALEALKRVDVLTICGDKDALTPLEHSEAICEALPEAELVVVKDGGHVALLEHPEEINAALLDFLERIA